MNLRINIFSSALISTVHCILLIILSSLLNMASCIATSEASPNNDSSHVAVISMDMMILPGTSSFLSTSINEANSKGAKLLIVELNTPGGIIDTSQEMIQSIFQSPIPVVVYVSPQGSMAGSAGVFITMASHVAAMAPGTSIGAAHPVQGDGKDIEGDMRLKTENMTVAMVKSIAEQRGRSAEWAEKSVKESSSLTEQEALKNNVVDFVAQDIPQLLSQIVGRKLKLGNKEIILEDYSKLPVVHYEMRYQDKFINVLANPNVAALIWLAATTGISIELYNPGLILPGVVGVIALILGLIVSQIIPISQGALALLIVGSILIGMELFTGSLVLGLGGILSLVIGVMYLVDTSRAPGMSVAAEFIVPIAVVLGGFLLYVAKNAYDVLRGKKSKSSANTGVQGMLMKTGVVSVQITSQEGKIFVGGEYWNAISSGEVIEVGASVVIVKVLPGLLLEVRRF